MSDDESEPESGSESEEKIKKAAGPNTISFKVFDEDEQMQILGLLLCKKNIKWKKYKSKEGWSQERKSVAFSKGWRCWELGTEMDIHPISKHQDIFDTINLKISEIIRNLKKNEWMDHKIYEVPNYWIAHRYLNNYDTARHHVDSKNVNSNHFVPVINICFGSARRIVIENKGTNEIIHNKLLKPGHVLFISEELTQTCKISLLSGSKKESDDSYHISLIGRFQTRY